MEISDSKRTSRRTYWGGMAFLMSVVAAGGLWMGAATASNDAQSAPNAEEQASIKHADQLSTAFRYASDRVLPAVVTIRTESAAREMTDMGTGENSMEDLPDELKNNPFFRRFFEDMGPMQQMPRSTPRRRQARGMGSGVIIDASGTILTNNHVVGSADRVIVRLHDGREFEAIDVKTDPKTDIAVVQIEGAGDLPVAKLGDSDHVEIGDWVLAVGAPFGLKETVTAGIISAKARGIGITAREEFLQTDAAINPGNSGGPLVNLRGELVGINTAISTTTGGYQGVGFAVPVNLAHWVSDELVAHGSVRRAFLGVGIQPVTSELSQQLGLDVVKGALVTQVQPETPAARAKLQPGDVIVKFDDREVDGPRALQGAVEMGDIGSKHEMEIVRDGKRMTMKVDLTELPKIVSATVEQEPAPATTSVNKLGLEVSNLTKDVADQLGLEDGQGVVITSVTPGSAADNAGLSSGMVVAKLGRENVANVDEFQAAVDRHPLEDGLLLLIKTKDGSRFVVLNAS